jgi:hypothetical protein
VTTPELKQFGELTAEDFEREPVWISCHTEDYDEPWYDQTDEETFRPWTGDLPISPSLGMLLVRATATLADGSTYPGFYTPAENDDLGLIQPQIFASGRLFMFWSGVLGVPRSYRDDFYGSIGGSPDTVFPIRFTAAPELVGAADPIEVQGFYKSRGRKPAKIER